MKCWTVIHYVRAALKTAPVGVKRAVLPRRIPPAQHHVAAHSGPVLRKVVEQVCRPSIYLPAIGAAAISGALLGGGLPAQRTEAPTQQAAPLGGLDTPGGSPDRREGDDTRRGLPERLQAGAARADHPTSGPATSGPATSGPATSGPALGLAGDPQSGAPQAITSLAGGPNPEPVREPASLIVLATGIAAMLYVRRRR